MSMITSAFSKSVYPAPFTSWIGLGYELYPDMVARMGFEIKSSSQSIEEVTVLSGLGTMARTAEAEATLFDDMAQGLTKQYAHAEYRLGFIVSQTLIEDGKGLNVVQEGAKQLGIAYNETRNLIAANIWNTAFASTNLSADGATLISNSHPTSVGNMSNILSTNATLSEASIEQARIDLKSIKNDRGIRQQIRLMKLIVPAALEFEAARLLGTEKRVGGADNDISAIHKIGVVKDGYEVVDYLTDSNAYFYTTNVSSNGLVFYDRKKLTLSDDTQFSTDNAMFKSHARMTAGCGEFRHVFGSQGL